MLDHSRNLTKHSETQRRRDSGNVGVGFHSLYPQDDVVVRRILSLSWRKFVLNRSTQPTRLSPAKNRAYAVNAQGLVDRKFINAAHKSANLCSAF